MAKIRFSNDPKTVKALRGILGDPILLGKDAATASDEEIIRAAEVFAESFEGAAAQLRVAFEPIAAGFRRLAQHFGVWAERHPDAYEQLVRASQANPR